MIVNILAIFVLAVVINAGRNIGVQISVWVLLSILLGIYAEVELLTLMVIMFTFLGAAILFSIATAWFYIPTRNTQRFQFLHIPPTLVFLIALLMRLIAILTRSYLSVLLICSSLVDHVFICLLAICVSLDTCQF